MLNGLAMLDGISTTCFASSYGVSLGLAGWQLFSTKPLRRKFLIGFAAAGLVAHTIYLFLRARAASASPLSSPYDWYLLAAWTLMALYFYLEAYFPRAAVALFVLPLVLALIGVAQFADDQPFATARASRGWSDIHGTSLLLGTVSVIVGFVAGLMYLLQSYRLKRRLPSSESVRLPSLEWLGTLNARSIACSVLFVGVGFVSGLILNLLQRAEAAQRLAWSDPTVWSVGGMFVWLLTASLFSGFYRPVRQGRKVAYLTIATFLLLAAVFALFLFGPTQHVAGGAR